MTLMSISLTTRQVANYGETEARSRREGAFMAIITLDPRSTRAAVATRWSRAIRPVSLEGQILGLVCNGVGDCEVMFDQLGVVLTERYGVAGIVKVVKRSVAVPPEPDQWVRVTDRATVAVTGFGGCGSCSTRSLRDALELEAIGIPAVLLVHTALVAAVNALNQFLGGGDQAMVCFGYPHDPTAHWTEEESAGIAEMIAEAVRDQLVREPALVGAGAELGAS
jgi:hypothetical protein